MAETEATSEEPAKKRGKGPLFIGLLLAIILGGGAFYAVFSGLVLGDSGSSGHASDEVQVVALPDVTFVPLTPMVVSLGKAGQARHLKFQAELEVGRLYAAEVTTLMPRVLDVLNGYLRAVEVEELEDPRALFRLRAQMLRRVQVVTGEGRVRDLLVTEFVLN